MKRFLCLLLFCCVLLVLRGCGHSNPYGTVVVTGKVTVDGSPMDGITVSFSPSASDGTSAYGLTDANGNYKLTTGGAPFGTGAIPGTYNVAFSKTTTGTGKSLAEYESSGLSTRMVMPQTIHLIPEKFTKPNTAGFDPVEVKKSGKNNFDFNLVTQ